VNYLTKGSGPPLLMLAPGGFDATLERWNLSGVWKGMKVFDTLAEHFSIAIASRHRAGCDALATAEIFLQLLPKLEETHGVKDLADLCFLNDADETDIKTASARPKPIHG